MTLPLRSNMQQSMLIMQVDWIRSRNPSSQSLHATLGTALTPESDARTRRADSIETYCLVQLLDIVQQRYRNVASGCSTQSMLR